MIEKHKKKISFVTIMLACSLAMVGGFFLFHDTPTQALCDDLMEMMTDPMHNKMHTQYVETMYLLHGYIEDCHNNNMYEDTINYDQFQPENYDGYMEDITESLQLTDKDDVTKSVNVNPKDSIKIEEQINLP